MVTRYTHVTIQADDLAESARFYETVFDMDRVPSPNFQEPIEWLRCGDIQLHIVENDAEPPTFNHHALHVDDFESTYQRLMEDDGATFEAIPHIDAGFVDGHPPVYELPTGESQLYVRDPAGNLIEVNTPDTSAIDESVVPNVVDRSDITPPDPDDPAPVLYMDGLLAAIDRDGNE